MTSPLRRLRWLIAAIALSVLLPAATAIAPAGAVADSCGGLAATIQGTPGPDVIQGTPGDDVIAAGKGADVVFGNGGNDYVCGGGGSDWIKTGDGADRIRGGSGSDFIDSGGGPDDAAGGPGRDVVNGGPGADELKGKTGPDIVRGEAGNDTMRGNKGRDQLSGGGGTDVVSGGQGALDGCAGEEQKACESAVLPAAATLAGPTDFGAIEIGGGATTPRAFSLSNDGPGLLEVRSVTIAGPNAADFQIVADDGYRVVLPGESRTFDIVFDPSGVPGSRTALLQVATNDAAAPARSMTLTGEAMVPPQPPAAPGGLAATADGPTQVTIQWFDNATDEDAYEVERRSNSNGFAEIVELGPNATSFVDTSVLAETVYTYRVRARTDQLRSGYSNEASVVTPPEPPPPPGLDLALDRVYLNQAVPVADSSQASGLRIQPVESREGLVRAFVTANQTNSVGPEVVMHWRRSGGQSGSITLTGPGAVPTATDESSLATTFNSEFDTAFLESGLEVYVEVDPSNAIPEADETNNRYPATGWLDLDVTTVPLFRITMVPITYQGLTPNITQSSALALLDDTLRMLPIGDIDVEIRAPWTYTGSSWSDMLGQLANLRSSDGSTRFYHGIVVTGPGGGIAGIGYVGFPVAVSIQNDTVVAHELGHNLDLPHAPCGNPAGPNPNYPYAGGGIGTWGYDFVADVLRDPATYKDIMTYCGPEWISDYNYANALDYRLTSGQAQPKAAARMLLVSGAVGADGSVHIDRVSDVVTPSIDATGSDHRLAGFDRTRKVIFDVPFGLVRWEAVGPAGDAHGYRFLVTVPAVGFDPSSITRLEIDRAGVAVAAWVSPAGGFR